MKVKTRYRGSRGQGWRLTRLDVSFRPSFWRGLFCKDRETIFASKLHQIDFKHPVDLRRHPERVDCSLDCPPKLYLTEGSADAIAWLTDHATGRVEVVIVIDDYHGTRPYGSWIPNADIEFEAHFEKTADAVAFKLAML